jgi:hypothetical protein
MKTVHLVKSFTNYAVKFFCGQGLIDFRAFYLARTDLDANATALYTDTAAKATCEECLNESK